MLYQLKRIMKFFNIEFIGTDLFSYLQSFFGVLYLSNTAINSMVYLLRTRLDLVYDCVHFNYNKTLAIFYLLLLLLSYLLCTRNTIDQSKSPFHQWTQECTFSGGSLYFRIYLHARKNISTRKEDTISPPKLYYYRKYRKSRKTKYTKNCIFVKFTKKYFIKTITY